MEHRAELYTFTINLNRDANLEFDIVRIDTSEFENVIRKLGDPYLGPKVSKAVFDVNRVIVDYLESLPKEM